MVFLLYYLSLNIFECYTSQQYSLRNTGLLVPIFLSPGVDKVKIVARSCVSYQAVKWARTLALLNPWSWPTHPSQSVKFIFQEISRKDILPYD